MAEDEFTATSDRLAGWFERIRDRRGQSSNGKYQTDDVLAVLTLLARGNSCADIERATFISRTVIMKWRDAFMSGTIHYLYPDIADRAAQFDEGTVPHIRNKMNRVRLRHSWQQHHLMLEEGHNPYAKPNGHMTVRTDDPVG